MIPTHCPLCNKLLKHSEADSSTWYSCNSLIPDSVFWHFAINILENKINYLIVSDEKFHLRTDYGINKDIFKTKLSKVVSEKHVETIFQIPEPIYLELTPKAIKNKIKMLLTFC